MPPTLPETTRVTRLTYHAAVSETPTPPRPSGPSHIGRYAVRRRIGSGGFATVWLGYDEQLDAPVAIKVLADNWSEQHEVRTRFVEEGRYLRRVESPHVVPVYDAGSLEDGRPYLVMAYADQGTLTERLAAGGVTVPQALEVVTQVGAGLRALHDRGVLHRDVKPGNVLFRTVDPSAGAAGVRAMVGDLGLGKALDVSSRLTLIAGTPAYVAPEQAQGETPDPRADQFSLAVLTYQLLSGRLPWQHASLAAAATPTEPAPLVVAGTTLPPAVEEVLRRALAHDRRWRWPSVTAYVEALTHALEGWEGPTGPGTRLLPVNPQLTRPGERPQPSVPSQELPAPVPPPRPRRTGRRIAVAAAIVVALAGGAAGGYAGERALEEEPVAPTDVVVTDTTDTLSVVVPAGWDAVGTAGWVPPNGSGDAPALTAGTEPDWASDPTDEAHGVFAGLLPADALPNSLPGHPECESPGSPLQDESTNGEMVTAISSGCPGGVTAERLVEINRSQLLWVQVRGTDLPEVRAVLDSVQVDD
jgi:eukaryotic-like serine/threonine-protein kinase